MSLFVGEYWYATAASALLMNITTLFHLGITEAAADFHTSVLSVCSTEWIKAEGLPSCVLSCGIMCNKCSLAEGLPSCVLSGVIMCNKCCGAGLTLIDICFCLECTQVNYKTNDDKSSFSGENLS